MNPFSTDSLSDNHLVFKSASGCPEAPGGRAVPPWLRAENKWRVIPLSRGQAALFPPPGGKPVETFVEEDHLVGPGFRPPMVILGPAGAGLTTFHRWAQLRARQKEIDVVDLDFALIAQTADPAKQRALLASSWLKSNKDTKFPSDDDLAGTLDQFLLAGKPRAPSNDQLRAHILLRVDRLHRENKEILLGRLRDLVERQALEGARFAVLAHETAPLEDAEPFSSFLGVCEVYRLADFTTADVRSMWRDWVPDRAAQATDVARNCIEWTGGQPVLINLYLGRLFDVTYGKKTIPKETFEQVGAWLVEHPPRGAVQHWQRELARIVDGSTLLRRKAGSFLAGEVRDNVTREELPLFLAGWIGQDAEGRWAMRSKAHARWAEGPYRSPNRYYQNGGGK